MNPTVQLTKIKTEPVRLHLMLPKPLKFQGELQMPKHILQQQLQQL